MMLEWKPPLAKLDSYRLVYVSADGHRAEDTVPGSSESHTLRGLTPGMLYTVSISAERGRRTSAPATISAPTGQHRKKKHVSYSLHTSSRALSDIIERQNAGSSTEQEQSMVYTYTVSILNFYANFIFLQTSFPIYLKRYISI